MDLRGIFQRLSFLFPFYQFQPTVTTCNYCNSLIQLFTLNRKLLFGCEVESLMIIAIFLESLSSAR